MAGSAGSFVAAVRRRLDELNVERVGPTQDELDLFLLGETVPPRPIPQPDPECRDCWGSGLVCSCHGFAATYPHGRYPDSRNERCRCVRVRPLSEVTDGR